MLGCAEHQFYFFPMGERDDVNRFLQHASANEKKLTREKWYGPEQQKEIEQEELRCQFSSKVSIPSGPVSASAPDQKTQSHSHDSKTKSRSSRRQHQHHQYRLERCQLDLKQSTRTEFYRCDVCCLYGHTDIAPLYVHGDVKASKEGVAAHSFEACFTWYVP